MFSQPAIEALKAKRGFTDQLCSVVDELTRTVALYNGHEASDSDTLTETKVSVLGMVSDLVPQWGMPVHIISYDDEIVFHLQMDGKIQPVIILKAVQ